MDLISGGVGAIAGLLRSERALAWLGIAVCLSQAAMFSGLNLAIFSVSRLRLEVESAGGNSDAQKVLALRQQSNLTLATILWGNVAVTVLFALLSGSVLAGGAAFAFSTIVITFFGEIVPQAYFSRNALRIAAGCTPLLRTYRILLFPVAGPSAWLLDWWLGPEAIALFRERDFKALIAKHIEAAECDVGHLEGAGALNFLDLDDFLVCHEGTALDPLSIVCLPFTHGRPQLPAYAPTVDDPFLRRLNASGKKWVVFTEPSGQPCLALDTHGFLREVLFGGLLSNPDAHWHRPIVIRDPRTRLGEVISGLELIPDRDGACSIKHDLIVVWGEQRRIITGSDLLRRLLRGIAQTEPTGNENSVDR